MLRSRAPARIRLLVLSLGVLAVSGCGSIFSVSCAKPEDFGAVVDNGPLKMPAGRDAPDTRAALAIPALETPEAPRPADSPCLDTPPKFAPTAPSRPPA